MAVVTGDPLDEMQVRAQDVLNSRRSHDICDRGECFYPELVAEAGFVLALVEVARAACDQAHDDDWCPVCCEHPSHGHAEGCALARLQDGIH